MEDRTGSALQKVVAVLVIAVAAWILLRVVLSVVAFVAWAVAAVIAVVAILWAVQTLRDG